MTFKESAKFKGYRCFKREWAGFENLCPINVIIGRNNSGKSSLIDLVDILTREEFGTFSNDMQFSSTLNEAELSKTFRKDITGGELGGNHWISHGSAFVGEFVEWEITDRDLTYTSDIVLDHYYQQAKRNAIEDKIEGAIKEKKHPLSGKNHKRIYAEREISSEQARDILHVNFSGEGATNICRHYITGASEKYPRSLIQNKLLMALNHIFGKDADFIEIQVLQHDKESGGTQDHWEIYLCESSKGLIPLSRSGSGLQTVILVLLNLLVVPHAEGKKPSDCVFSFEELENNLHPALQRRLFWYITEFAVENNCYIFITTHSNVALDVFANSKHSQIIHVENDGESAYTKTIDAYFEKLHVVNDLGAKASDLLQANGIVWLEGPSDRIYFNKWIELLTDGTMKEGLDYQCAFYGGSILSHYTANPASNGRLNLLQVNPNAVLLADGDRTSKGSRIKQRVRDIKNEIEALPKSHVWVSKAKEVESYVPLEVLRDLFNKPRLKVIDQYEPFSKEPTKRSPDKGYFQKHSPTKTFNKVDFAQRVIPKLKLLELKTIFEWEKEMDQIVRTIQSWNER